MKLLPHDREKMEQFAIEGLIKGYPNSDLVVKLQEEFKQLDTDAANGIVRAALNSIRDSALVDLDKIIPVHIELYEKIYQEFEDLYFVPGKLKALRQKERLVGLHKETNTIEVYNEVNVEVEGQQEYDIGKLEPKEVKRLTDFMKRVMNK